MASNSFGTLFRITTWGESHGRAIGVVVDGCPSGLALSEEEIQNDLNKRAPGQKKHTSPRKEPDQVEIFSGVFEGVTTGAPISLLIFNRDQRSEDYKEAREVLRPNHANYTFLEKYGVYDYRGGGRASARETACRVAAGAIAKTLLATYGIEVFAEVDSVAGFKTPETIEEALSQAEKEGDSLPAEISFSTSKLPCGLGDPVYEKIGAKIAFGLMSIPSCKGVFFGNSLSEKKGSTYLDPFTSYSAPAANNQGGMQGGITNGNPIFGTASFKPPSSIMKEVQTVAIGQKSALRTLQMKGRHDPCVALRAPPIVSAMVALSLADALLLNRCARL